MKIPINTDNEGCAFTITARYSAMCWSNVAMGGARYPMTAIMETDERIPSDAEMREQKTAHAIRKAHSLHDSGESHVGQDASDSGI